MSHGYDMRQFTRQPDGTITQSNFPAPSESLRDSGPLPELDPGDDGPHCECPSLRAEEELRWNVCACCGKAIEP